MRAQGNIAHLVFSDANDNQCVQLGIRDDQPGLILSDAGGKERVRLKMRAPILCWH